MIKHKPELHPSCVLFTDAETFSTVDIKKAGTVKYTDEAELLLVGFQLGDRYEDWDYSRDNAFPEWALQHIRNGGIVAAHNALFDYLVLKEYIPFLRLEQMIDTQAIVAAHGLPLSLEKAGDALNLDADKKKLKDGKRLVTKFCTPRKPSKLNPSTRVRPKDAPEDWKRFRDEYLRLDIESMAVIYSMLSPLSDDEQKVWLDTQRINLRGIPVDVSTTRLIINKLDKLVDEESSKFIRLTSLFPTQRDKVLAWVNAEGCPLKNLQAATIAEALKDPATPDIVKEALTVRANTTHMSFKKYPTILAAVREDAVVCGTLMYHVAHTGRFGGRLLQPQNLTRGTIDGEEAVARIHSGEFSVDLVKSCVRPMIWHPNGFTISDYSSIEARVLQWLANDKDAIAVFLSGDDPYKWMATKIYGVEYDDVTYAQRFCGKQAILGLGYQMSANKFIEMVESYGEVISVEEAKLAVNTYRKVHDKVVKLWRDIQEAAVMALHRPGKTIRLSRLLKFHYDGTFLCMYLPSGRPIRYYQPRLTTSFGDWTFSYMGVNEKSQYVRVTTYGGKLVENAVQGISRDILVDAVGRMLDQGYDIVTHIHDEVVSVGHHDVEAVESIMCDAPEWAEGIPLAAEGFNSARFKKG